VSQIIFVIGGGLLGGAVIPALFAILFLFVKARRTAAVEQLRAARFEDVTEQNLPIPRAIDGWMGDFARLGFRRLGDVLPRRGRPMRILVSADGSSAAYVSERPRSFGIDTWFADGAAMETSLCGVTFDYIGRHLVTHQSKGSVEALVAKHNASLASRGTAARQRLQFETIADWLAADIEHRDRLAEEHIDGVMGLVDRRFRQYALAAAVLAILGAISIALALA
jgi:hypothetical protein